MERASRGAGLRPLRHGGRRQLRGTRCRRGARVDACDRAGRQVPRVGDRQPRSGPAMIADKEPRAVSSPAFDAVTLEVVWRRMISAADEAGKTLQRTSFSTLVNESNDFACVLTDARGQSLVQNTD